MMKTFLDLTLSPISILTYPSAKRPTLIWPKSTFNISAISYAKALLELPVKMTIFFLDKIKEYLNSSVSSNEISFLLWNFSLSFLLSF